MTYCETCSAHGIVTPATTSHHYGYDGGERYGVETERHECDDCYAILMHYPLRLDQDGGQMTPHWSDRLYDIHACDDAVAWAHTQPSLAVAWERCERSDWMLWLLARLDGEPCSPRLRLAACACARTVLHLVPPGEERPRVCIETAERHARGTATDEDLRAAAEAAEAAEVAWVAGVAEVVWVAGAASYQTQADAIRRVVPTVTLFRADRSIPGGAK